MIVSTDQEPGSAATSTVGIKIGWALLAVLFIAWMLVCFSFGLIFAAVAHDPRFFKATNAC